MAKILILDDDPNRHVKFSRRLIGNTIRHTRTAAECIQALEKDDQYDYIFLDHDLGKEFEASSKGTGYEVADWIANHPQKTARQQIIIHSLNSVGAKAMISRLRDAGITATHTPFLWEKLNQDRI